MPVLNYSRAGSGEPLVIMHGLFGSARNWQTLARRFAEHFDVVNVDMRNHGQSFHDDEMSYPAMAADLLGLMRALGLGPAHLLGHSMGGKVAMTLAAEAPERLARVVVADIAPVAYRHSHNDLVEPILALAMERVESRADVDRQLRAAIPDAHLRAFLMHNLYRDGDRWRWRVNWAAIARHMGALVGFDHLAPGWRCANPALFIRGGASDYVGPREVAAIEEHFADFRLLTLDGAGHWLHAEQPETFAGAVLEFLGSA